jgi:hypothetical protein
MVCYEGGRHVAFPVGVVGSFLVKEGFVVLKEDALFTAKEFFWLVDLFSDILLTDLQQI